MKYTGSSGELQVGILKKNYYCLYFLAKLMYKSSQRFGIPNNASKRRFQKRKVWIESLTEETAGSSAEKKFEYQR